MGTTSACAENTRKGLLLRLRDGNYLRVRGEYGMVAALCSTTRELPPRARRIPHPPSRGRSSPGTTSACAENTTTPAPVRGGSWNYLRVRGEYIGKVFPSWWESELPPRARRIPGVLAPIIVPHGTTSACAENTVLLGPRVSQLWNYLRVRGEYPR